MKKIYLFLCGLFTITCSFAQQHIVLRINFNQEQNRFEVLAKPDFSAKQFTWGPSQVSVVLPAEIENQTISPRSTNIGVWADNSVIYGPAAAPASDFHGFTTQGAKIDLVAGTEILLFDFSLKQGFVNGVRLFNPLKDPSSTQQGMNGGDFASYMADEKGKNLFVSDTASPVLTVKTDDTAGKNTSSVILGDAAVAAVKVVAYPNPATNSIFRLFLQGFNPNENLSVQINSLSGKVLKTLTEKAETLAGKSIRIGTVSDAYVIVSVTRTERQQTISQKVWFID